MQFQTAAAEPRTSNDTTSREDVGLRISFVNLRDLCGLCFAQTARTNALLDLSSYGTR